jgi:hypothetical protein
MKYINMDFSELDERLRAIIDRNEDYRAAKEKLGNCLDRLDKAKRDIIDNSACLMEAIAIDTAYNEGFSEGIRFILGCIASGKEVTSI